MSSENHIADDRKKVRLIDANALPVTTLTDGEYWTKDVVYKRDIDEAPTVDAVEVVHCKDCINCSTIKSEITRDINWFCEYWRGHPKICPMGFCSYGERRTDG